MDKKPNTPPQQPKAFNIPMQDMGWFVINIALKAIGVMITYNLIIEKVYPSLHSINFGVAVAMVLLVKFLFSNLDGFSKFQTRHLFDMKNVLIALHSNQVLQNNAILLAIQKLKGSDSSAKEPQIPEEVVDDNNKKGYNTSNSEK